MIGEDGIVVTVRSSGTKFASHSSGRALALGRANYVWSTTGSPARSPNVLNWRSDLRQRCSPRNSRKKTRSRPAAAGARWARRAGIELAALGDAPQSDAF